MLPLSRVEIATVVTRYARMARAIRLVLSFIGTVGPLAQALGYLYCMNISVHTWSFFGVTGASSVVGDRTLVRFPGAGYHSPYLSGRIYTPYVISRCTTAAVAFSTSHWPGLATSLFMSADGTVVVSQLR